MVRSVPHKLGLVGSQHLDVARPNDGLCILWLPILCVCVSRPLSATSCQVRPRTEEYLVAVEIDAHEDLVAQLVAAGSVVRWQQSEHVLRHPRQWRGRARPGQTATANVIISSNNKCVRACSGNDEGE